MKHKGDNLVFNLSSFRSGVLKVKDPKEPLCPGRLT